MNNGIKKLPVKKYDDRIYQYELQALRFMFPGASANRLRKLRELAVRKGVKIVDLPAASPSLTNLMCSIIRHKSSPYEHLLRNDVSRDNARGLISPIVESELKRMMHC